MCDEAKIIRYIFISASTVALANPVPGSAEGKLTKRTKGGRKTEKKGNMGKESIFPLLAPLPPPSFVVHTHTVRTRRRRVDSSFFAAASPPRRRSNNDCGSASRENGGVDTTSETHKSGGGESTRVVVLIRGLVL